MQTAYPTASDLSDFLAKAGFTLSAALEQQLEMTIASAIADFERATGRVMLAPADDEDETRRYDPPTYGQVLQIDDLAAFTSLEYQPQGAAAEEWTENEEFWLKPYNVTNPPRPYTLVEFRRRWLDPLPGELRRSIRITGRFGYGTQGADGTGMPDDVWSAMLARGAWLLAPDLAQSLTAGLAEYEQGDTKIRYFADPVNSFKDIWAGGNGNGGQYGRTVALYRRLSL